MLYFVCLFIIVCSCDGSVCEGISFVYVSNSVAIRLVFSFCPFDKLYTSANVFKIKFVFVELFDCSYRRRRLFLLTRLSSIFNLFDSKC